MKLHITFISTLLMIVIFPDCRKKSNVDNHKLIDSTFNVSEIPKKLEKMTIVFCNEEKLSVVHTIHDDLIVDSIEIRSNTFYAIFDNCHKGSLNINLFESLRKDNYAEYEKLSKVTTAYTLHDKNQNKLSFNGFQNDFCNVPRESNILVYASIYKLFIKQMNISNILVIDSIGILDSVK